MSTEDVWWLAGVIFLAFENGRQMWFLVAVSSSPSSGSPSSGSVPIFVVVGVVNCRFCGSTVGVWQQQGCVSPAGGALVRKVLKGVQQSCNNVWQSLKGHCSDGIVMRGGWGQ